MERQRETLLAERKVVTIGRTTPVAAVAAPLPLRPLSNEERLEIMRDGILARMKPDQNDGETAARLCPLHIEAGNSLATAGRLIAGNTLLVTRVDLRKERGMCASAAAAATACFCC